MAELSVDIRLRVVDFSLEFAHKFALQGITALFGPSGCGKTTLLRVVAGHERGAEGFVACNGETWLGRDTFTPPHRRGVGFVFQDARLFAHRSVAGNLHFAERRAPRSSGRTSFEDVVSRLDLGPLLQRRPVSLSGGERQRVAIGRSLLSRPRLLLMDEPLASLDVHRKGEILPYIAGLPAAFDIPILYVTHSLDEVTRLADRMVALADGRLVAAGSVVEVLESLDVEAATGHFEAGVVLEGIVTGHDAAYRITRITVAGQNLEMPGVELPSGSEVRLRVRARDVVLATRRPAEISVRNILRGRVATIVEEPDTAFAETLIDIGGQKLRSRITRASVADLRLTPGTEVFALIKSIAFDRRALPGGPVPLDKAEDSGREA